MAKQFSSKRKIDWDGGPLLLKKGGVTLAKLVISNRDSAEMFLHLWDHGVEETPGEGEPTETYPIPPNWSQPIPIAGVTSDFTNGLVLTLTDSADGTGDGPETAAIVNARFR